MDHCPSCHEELPRSTDGSVETLQQRILFLENELLQATLARPRCTESAFQTYIEGVVADAVAEERTRFSQMYQELERENAALSLDLRSENLLLEAVLQKYNITHAAALHAAVSAYPPPLEKDPSYTKYIKMSQRAASSSFLRRTRK